MKYLLLLSRGCINSSKWLNSKYTESLTTHFLKIKTNEQFLKIAQNFTSYQTISCNILYGRPTYVVTISKTLTFKGQNALEL